MTAPPLFIVAEISKNWRRNGWHVEDWVLSKMFEHVIAENLQRGYVLYDFHLHRFDVPPLDVNETIIAVFRWEPML